MKNILFVHSSSELYGSDRSLLNIIKHINKKKYFIYVILPCFGPLVDEMKKIDGVEVEIYEVAVLRRKNLSFKGGIQYLKEFIVSYKYLKKFIREKRIDLVDTNTAVVFPGAIAAKHCKVKSIWHIREIIKSNIENRVVSFMMNHYSDFIIANSKATGKALRVNQGKIQVVYNAVEEKTDSICCNTHGKKTVGMAGRINRWKGQKLFVDAAEIVHKVMPDIVFEIAGEAYAGEEYLKEDLLQYIREKKLQETVFLLGQVNNMGKFYADLDIFVLPSIQPEPFGLVVIEAMEYGIPVIATNHGGPKEIITEGKDGFLVDYCKPDQMAECILSLMVDESKRKQIGMEGRKKKRKYFSVCAMVNKIETVFELALNQ